MNNYSTKKITLLQTLADATFNNNLNALKQFMPEVFEYYKNYIPKNFQLIVNEKNNINLRNLSSNTTMYPGNPINDCHSQVALFFQKPKRFCYLPDIDETEKSEHLFLNSFHITRCQKIIKEQLKSKNSINKTVDIHDYIPSMIIIGAGLGYHIEKLYNEHHIDELFIFEPDSDVFYACLHTINLYPILKKSTEEGRSLTLQIGNSSDSFISTIQLKLEEKGLFSSSRIYIYKHYDSAEANDTTVKIQNTLHRIYFGWGFFEDELIGISHTLNNVKNKGRILIKNEVGKLPNHNQILPALIIGNGPSLDQEIEFIKNNQNKFILFSCGSALKPLYKAGIVPDFHVEIERTKSVYDWIMDINDLEYTKKIRLLGINTLYPDTAPLFKEFIWGFKSQDSGKILFDQTYQQASFAHFLYCHPTVVNGSLSTALSLGLKEIYLIGTDMGFKDASYHHSKNSSYLEKESPFYQQKMKYDMVCAGNFSEKVYTNQDFDYSRHVLEIQLQAHPEVQCFNCSDGAKIQLTTPMRTATISKKEFSDEAKNFTIENLILNCSVETTSLDKIRTDQAIDELKESSHNFIQLLQESLSHQPKNRHELSLHFQQQFSWVKRLKETNRALYIMTVGTVNSMQSIIYSNLLNVRDESDFIACIEKSFAVFNDYLNDSIKISEKYFQGEHKMICLEDYFKNYE